MAVYNWSTLTNDQQITFDSTQDTIVFDVPGASWSTLNNWTWSVDDEDFTLGLGDKHVDFIGLGKKEIAADTVTMPDGGQLLVGDLLTSTDGDDDANIITGSENPDVIFGCGGDDTLGGQGGDDKLVGESGNDTINGGEGSDIAFYLKALTDPVVADLGSGIVTQAGFTDTLISIESLRGSSGNDTLRGNELNNMLSGIGGDDQLEGRGGNDTLIGDVGNDGLNGGDGNDTLNGGDGTDTAVFSDAATGSVSADLGAGTAYQSGFTDTLISIENLRGGGGDDDLQGNWQSNWLNGSLGNDSLDGDDGNDTLLGGEGIDYLEGGRGDDLMVGGLGDDLYIVDSAGDVTTETSTAVDETDKVLVSGRINWKLDANIEDLQLWETAGASNGTGNTLDNTLYGNAWANTLNGLAGNDALLGGSGNDNLLGGDGTDTLIGGAGADSLNGGTGADTLIGGLGNDSYYIDNAGDLTTETSTIATEVDTVVTTVSRTLGVNIERLILSSTAAINGTGNTLKNTLTGNAAANILNGGASADTMAGGLGNDTYYVDNAADLTTETSTLATEIDTVVSTVSRTLGANIERLTLAGSAAINGTGNTLNNTLTGNAAANTLNGAAGNDVLSGGVGNDTLIGGLGNDTLVGGAGKDIFLFDTTLNATTNRDSLTDFSVVDDTIRMDRTIFARLTTLGTLNSALFKASATGKAMDSNDYLLYNTTTGALLYDQDGTGVGAATQFAILTTKPALTAADFAVVA